MAPDPGADLSFNTTKGQVLTFHLKSQGELLNTGVEVDYEMTRRQEVVEVGEQDIKISYKNKIDSIVIGGKSDDSPLSSTPIPENHLDFERFKPDGSVTYHGTDTPNASIAACNLQAIGVLRPKQPLQFNQPLTFKLAADPLAVTTGATVTYCWVGNESVDGIDCWKIQEAYDDNQLSAHQIQSRGTLWVSTDDHELVKLLADIRRLNWSLSLQQKHMNLEIERIPNSD